MKPWVEAARPKTLGVAVASVFVGSALALSTHGIFSAKQFVIFFSALFCALFIQVGTNFINDAFDAEYGVDKETRLGPRRLAQSGLLSSSQLKSGAVLVFALAVLLAIPLVIQGGWPVFWVGAISIASGVLYTASGFSLARIGLGEVFVLVFFGWVPVLTLGYLFGVPAQWAQWLAGTQIGMLAAAIIAINNLRDRNSDLVAGRKTLAIRLGETRMRRLIFILLVAPAFLGIMWLFLGKPLVAFLPLSLLPKLFRIGRFVLRAPLSPALNGALVNAARMLVLFSVLLSLGFFA